jgi:PAS domain S-box-containing protein
VQASISKAIIDNRERIIVCFHEIDGRKKAEQALRKSEANLRSIFDNTHIGFALLDQSLNVVCCNARANDWATDSLGVELEEGKNVTTLLRDYNKKEYLAMLHRALNGESINIETAYPLLDGSINWYRVRMNAVHTPEENIIGVIVSAENITASKLDRMDRDRMIKELIQRNKEHEQFAYIVSHNLRGPLANILGYTSLIQEEDNTCEDKEEYLQLLSASANKLDETIRDLGKLLQLKKDISEVKEWVNFSQIVEDVKIGVRNITDDHIVVFDTDFSEADEMFTFKIYLYSIFYNLISNSIKYKNHNRKKTIIKIKSYKKGNKIKLTFRDNGIGIDLEKNKEFVFGLYKRFHPQISAGKGVGLCMTKMQIEALGGEIDIKSKVNNGTQFVIYLPNEVEANYP